MYQKVKRARMRSFEKDAAEFNFEASQLKKVGGLLIKLLMSDNPLQFCYGGD